MGPAAPSVKRRESEVSAALLLTLGRLRVGARAPPFSRSGSMSQGGLAAHTGKSRDGGDTLPRTGTQEVSMTVCATTASLLPLLLPERTCPGHSSHQALPLPFTEGTWKLRRVGQFSQTLITCHKG